MICIGVYGDGAERVVRQLNKKYFDAGIDAAIYMGSGSYAEFKNFEDSSRMYGKGVVLCEATEMDYDIKYDILIVISAEFNKISKIKNVKDNGYIIINADDCRIFPYMIPENINVVTCGVNSSAALTFSGISENRNGRECIQCCIQREIKTLSGRKIEPQEFSVNVIGLEYPISEVLAITATAITGDIEETVTADSLI